MCVLAIRDGIVPPTINYRVPDPECDLDYVPNVARELQVDVALSNAMGLGGHNGCVLLGRVELAASQSSPSGQGAPRPVWQQPPSQTIHRVETRVLGLLWRVGLRLAGLAGRVLWTDHIVGGHVSAARHKLTGDPLTPPRRPRWSARRSSPARRRRARVPPRAAGSAGSGRRSRAGRQPWPSGGRAPSPRSPRLPPARRRAGGPPRGRRRAPACRGRPASDDSATRTTSSMPGRAHDGLDQLRVRRRGDAERPALGHPAHGSDGARDERRLRAVADEHALDDRVVDLRRRARNAESLREVARPLGRAHPHHRPGRLGRIVEARARARTARAPRPTPARSRRSRRPGRRRRPGSQRLDTRRGRRRASVAARPSSSRSIAPTKRRVVADLDPVDGARDQPACGAGEQARIVVAHLDAGPHRDRRHAAREVPRDLLLVARQDRHTPRSGLDQQLVQRRRARDRDADERGLERQRDERRDRQARRGGRPRRRQRPTRRQASAGTAPSAPHRPPSRGDRRNGRIGQADEIVRIELDLQPAPARADQNRVPPQARSRRPSSAGAAAGRAG